MGEAELGLAVDGTGWRATRTSDNREGDGLATPCQEQRYADPRARAALVRSFTTSPAKGEPNVSAVQTAELSDNLKARAEDVGPVAGLVRRLHRPAGPAREDDAGRRGGRRGDAGPAA